jgi:hypothetical protein
MTGWGRADLGCRTQDGSLAEHQTVAASLEAGGEIAGGAPQSEDDVSVRLGALFYGVETVQHQL